MNAPHLCILTTSAALLALAGCHPPTPAATTIHMSGDPSTTQLIGEGRLSAAPEYIELAVTIRSECFASPADASAANDRATARVLEILRGAISHAAAGDGVFSHGGFTQPFSRYSGTDRLICDQTFQKTATVVMKTSRIEDFPRELARIQSEILGGTLRKPRSSAGEAPITFATMEAPVPRLNFETRERLEKDALAAALASARSKLARTIAGTCKNGGHRVVKFIERSPGDGRPIPYQATQAPASDESAVAFDAIWINKLLEVHFELDAEKCSS